MIQKIDTIAALEKIAAWCAYLLIFALPFSKSIVEVCVVLLLITIAAKKMIKKERFFANIPLAVPLLVFLAASSLSLFNTEYLYLSLRGLISKYLEYALIYIVVIEAIRTKEALKDLLTIALISLAVVVLDGYIQYYITHADLLHLPNSYPSFKYIPEYKSDPFIGFPTASFPYPNDLAAWLLMYLLPALSVALFCVMRWRTRLAFAVSFVPAFYLFVLTKARGAYLGLLAATVFLIVFDLKKALIVILALALIFSALALINRILPSDAMRYESLMDDILSFSSVTDRMDMWQKGWKIFSWHPVIGNGINTFFQHFAQVREDEYKFIKGSYIHNCYLQMAAETGVVGLSAFLFFIGAFFVSTIKKLALMRDRFYRALSTGLMAGICAFLVHSLFDTNLYSLNLAALFWFSLGLTTVVTMVGGQR